MLGAVAAFRRSEHMRMTALVSRAGPKPRAFLEGLALAAALAFLALLIRPAYEHAMDEVFITTPALEISNVWRAAALPAGLALMTISGLVRLARSTPLWPSFLALLAVAAATAVHIE
jgi:TRAP-type C4-dicarboxylate transport system permease small subunit